MTVRLLEIAEIELDQAVNWYRAQAPGSGDAFLIEVHAEKDPARADQQREDDGDGEHVDLDSLLRLHARSERRA